MINQFCNYCFICNLKFQIVNLLTTAHGPKGATWVHRRVKEQGRWRQKLVRKPGAINDYNTYMGGVDKSDQLLARYNVLHKTRKWWKTLFFHLIDVAVVNSYIIFEKLRKRFSDDPRLRRPTNYGQLQFREELVRELVGIGEYEDYPVYEYKAPANPDYHCEHMPEFEDIKRNCKVCYKNSKTENKSFVVCSKCNVNLCLLAHRNCFKTWHSVQFHK